MFMPVIAEGQRERVQTEIDLRLALENDEFEL